MYFFEIESSYVSEVVFKLAILISQPLESAGVIIMNHILSLILISW